MSKLNPQIKEAIDSFDIPLARQLLKDALKEADAETFFLASQVAVDDDQKREFLQKAVDADPFYEKARKALNQPAGNQQSVQQQTPPSNPPNGNPTYVEGTIIGANEGNTNLYVIPNIHSKIRTYLQNGTIVYLVDRYDDYAKQLWFQVVYHSPVTTVTGWIQSAYVTNINVQGISIQPLDLPITNFENHKRGDFLETYKLRDRQNNVLVFIHMVIMGVLVNGAFLVGSLLQVGGIGLIIGIGLAIAYAVRRLSNPVITGKELGELNKLQKSMRSNYEVVRDDQRANMALNAALNLGVNMGTRLTPNKYDVKIRHTNK